MRIDELKNTFQSRTMAHQNPNFLFKLEAIVLLEKNILKLSKTGAYRRKANAYPNGDISEHFILVCFTYSHMSREQYL